MRSILLVPALCLALALTACGDSSNAFEFRSISAEPTGDKINITYDMKPGDGVRVKMKLAGSMTMSGDMDMSRPVNMKMSMSLKCLEARENGEKVLEMALDDFAEMDLGKELESVDLSDLSFKGTMTIDKNGKVTETKFETSDPAMDEKFSQMMNNPGFQYFVPIPEGGMRVGEAIDLAKIMPADMLEKLMSQVAGGGTMKPDLRGEIVLLGTRDIGGEKAAEFGVNMVMNLQAEMSQGGTEVEMDMGMRIKGTQYSSLRTGLPLGTATWTMDMRTDMAAEGQAFEMEMNATMTIECELLK